MSLREAAKKALEALIWEAGYSAELYTHKTAEAVKALRSALAEADEPVAWYSPSGEGYDSAFRDHSTVMACDGGDWSGWVPLYTHPPRREPLTVEAIDALTERVEFLFGFSDDWAVHFARAIERAHGIGPPSRK